MVEATKGITCETTQRFVLDAGAVYLDYGTGGERLLGATRGGDTFIVETDYKDMEMDGVRFTAKDAVRIVAGRARIECNLLEITADNLQKIISGSAKADYPSSMGKTHDKITRSRDIIAGDFITNVAIVARVSGADENFIGIVYNALSKGNLSIGLVDKDEAVLACSFVAHQDCTTPDVEPWEIRFPVITPEGT